MNLFKEAKSFIGKDKNSTKNENSDSNNSNTFNIFNFLDKNNDGKITEEDFVLIVDQAGLGIIGRALVKKVFQTFDTNKNGCLDHNEVLGAFEKVKDLFNSTSSIFSNNNNDNKNHK